MTCIVGLVKGGKIYMGGDSCGSNGYLSTKYKNHKIFKVKDFLFGYTSSFRMGQVIEHNFIPPAHVKGVGTTKYMVSVFVPELRKCLKDSGYLEVQNNVETGGVFLVGYRNKLYKIQDDFAVLESANGYNAVGCGEAVALGSLYSTQKTKIASEERLRLALSASEAHNAGVRKPFHFKMA